MVDIPFQGHPCQNLIPWPSAHRVCKGQFTVSFPDTPWTKKRDRKMIRERQSAVDGESRGEAVRRLPPNQEFDRTSAGY